MYKLARNLSGILVVLILILPTVVRSQGIGVTVTNSDTEAKVQPILTRWDQYTTLFNAVADGKPTPLTEGATVGDPIWHWRGPGASPAQPGFSISPAGSSCVVRSAGNGIPEAGAFVKGGGQYTITVEATATWTDNTGQTYTSDPGTGTATFFVIVPTKVNAVLQSNTKFSPPDYPYWGHSTAYTLTLVDNQLPARPYAHGLIREAFSNVQYNPAYVYNLQHSHPPLRGIPTLEQPLFLLIRIHRLIKTGPIHRLKTREMGHSGISLIRRFTAWRRLTAFRTFLTIRRLIPLSFIMSKEWRFVYKSHST